MGVRGTTACQEGGIRRLTDPLMYMLTQYAMQQRRAVAFRPCEKGSAVFPPVGTVLYLADYGVASHTRATFPGAGCWPATCATPTTFSGAWCRRGASARGPLWWTPYHSAVAVPNNCQQLNNTPSLGTPKAPRPEGSQDASGGAQHGSAGSACPESPKECMRPAAPRHTATHVLPNTSDRDPLGRGGSSRS